MLIQASHVAWVFGLAIELLPSFRLIGPLDRVAITVEFVFIHGNLFVVYKVFGIDNTAVETAAPL